MKVASELEGLIIFCKILKIGMETLTTNVQKKGVKCNYMNTNGNILKLSCSIYHENV